MSRSLSRILNQGGNGSRGLIPLASLLQKGMRVKHFTEVGNIIAKS